MEEFLEEERYEVKRNSDNEDFPQFKEGILAKKGHELGRFNMGSTVVMFFEGDKDFIFDVKEGQKVKYGDIVGRFKV